jgi:acetyl-CoA carboxylase biotin carboxyl carrier protein
MDIRKVKKLIELLEESGIDELEITEGEESVRICRHRPVSATHVVAAPAPVIAAAPAPVAATSAEPNPGPAPAPVEPATHGLHPALTHGRHLLSCSLSWRHLLR